MRASFSPAIILVTFTLLFVDYPSPYYPFLHHYEPETIFCHIFSIYFLENPNFIHRLLLKNLWHHNVRNSIIPNYGIWISIFNLPTHTHTLCGSIAHTCASSNPSKFVLRFESTDACFTKRQHLLCLTITMPMTPANKHLKRTSKPSTKLKNNKLQWGSWF